VLDVENGGLGPNRREAAVEISTKPAPCPEHVAKPKVDRDVVQRTVFRKDKASAGLRTGRAPKKKSFPPHFSVEARGCGRLRPGGSR